MNEYMINQISIFSENRPGRLASVAKTLQDKGINMLAFCIAEAGAFGVIRALVSDPERAYHTLKDMGFTLTCSEVIGVKMKNEPGGLYEVAEILEEDEINIEYSYAYTGRENSVLILRVDKIEEAIESMQQRGLELLRADDVLR